jgi:hypothetical protein
VLQNYITNPSKCCAASAPSLGSLYIVLLKLQNNEVTKLYKTVGRHKDDICLYFILYLFIFLYLFGNTIYKPSQDGAEAPKHIDIYIYIYKYIYLYLTAIGLTPGGSGTVHIYTQTLHRIQKTEHKK